MGEFCWEDARERNSVPDGESAVLNESDEELRADSEGATTPRMDSGGGVSARVDDSGVPAVGVGGCTLGVNITSDGAGDWLMDDMWCRSGEGGTEATEIGSEGRMAADQTGDWLIEDMWS